MDKNPLRMTHCSGDDLETSRLKWHFNHWMDMEDEARRVYNLPENVAKREVLEAKEAARAAAEKVAFDKAQAITRSARSPSKRRVWG